MCAVRSDPLLAQFVIPEVTGMSCSDILVVAEARDMVYNDTETCIGYLYEDNIWP